MYAGAMSVTQLRRALQAMEARGLGHLRTDAVGPHVIDARLNQLCLRDGFVQSGIVGKWLCENEQRMVGAAEAFESRDLPAWICVTGSEQPA
jgi:hypothetical protein